MIETWILLIFCVTLIAGTICGLPLALLLAAGALLFANYGLRRGCSMTQIGKMCLEGPRQVGQVLFLFGIIGMLTATWRASGAIPLITCMSIDLAHPATLVVASFLLCAVMSFLMGSSFGAAATTGVVCMAVGSAMGTNEALMAGAILSGSFFGDRCSPMSSSAALVASLTGTKVSDNLGRMARTAAVPLLAAIVFYALAGVLVGTGVAAKPHFAITFRQVFELNWIVITPIVLALVLSILRMPVRVTMLSSLALAMVLCVTVQEMPVSELPGLLVFGYHSGNATIQGMTDGGGILSMVDLAVIVTIASTYSGLFRGTGLLDNLRRGIQTLADRTTPFTGVLLTSIATAIISCDQIVATMLTTQLCEGCERTGSAMALDLENSSVIIPALIPWSTSVVGILAFIEAPVTGTLFAVYAVFVPAWTMFLSFLERRDSSFVDSRKGRMMGLNEDDDARRQVEVEPEVELA